MIVEALPGVLGHRGKIAFISGEQDRTVCLYDLILYLPSTIFKLCRDGSSLVDPVLS